ncbi:MAG: DUF3649 domain-containing protein [Bacteroidaceae bacterium]|nr:DUF3649 domain-containing protein [Bacteroidaceae bacterium]
MSQMQSWCSRRGCSGCRCTRSHWQMWRGLALLLL